MAKQKTKNSFMYKGARGDSMISENQRRYLMERFKMCLERRHRKDIFTSCLVASSAFFGGMACIFVLSRSLAPSIVCVVGFLGFVVLKVVFDHKKHKEAETDEEELNKAMEELI